MEVTALYASRRSTDTQDLRSLGFNYVGDTAADTESFSVAPQLSIDAWSDWDFSVRGVMAESSLRATTTREGAVPSGFGVFNELRTLELSGTGTLISLPNGGVRLAVGAGYREEEQRYTSVSGFVASRDVRYVYGEVLVPLVAPSDTRAGLNRLELSLAGRLEDYSDFGSSANPRVGLRYSPLAGLNLRGTWGRSFKAPLFRELYGPNVVQALPAIVYGSSSPGNVLGMNGGNPDLGPERSTSWTVGFDWRRGINISATYFNTSYRDRIVVPFTSGGTALIDPASAAFVNRSPTLAEINEIVSSATTFLNTTGGPYDPGSIIAIVDARFVNAAAQRIRGVDISMSRQFRTGLGDIGVFTNASWLNFSQRTLPTLPATTRTGLVFYPAQFRARGGVTYRTGNLTSSIAVNHVSGSTDNFATPPTDVSAWTTVDLSLSYHFPAWSASVEGLDAALSVTNLFDNDPPFVASGGLRYPGFFYDSSNTSAMGRFVAATIRQRF
jgi:iron complex outermembrane receptor protein